MSKVKVYELAKELGKDSKNVVKFLEGKNIEVKGFPSFMAPRAWRMKPLW